VLLLNRGKKLLMMGKPCLLMSDRRCGKNFVAAPESRANFLPDLMLVESGASQVLGTAIASCMPTGGATIVASISEPEELEEL
jgi:hypothetical protein